MGVRAQARLALIEQVQRRAMTECVQRELTWVQNELYKNNENEFLTCVHEDLSTGLWLLDAFRVREAIEIEPVWRVIRTALLHDAGTLDATTANATPHAGGE